MNMKLPVLIALLTLLKSDNHVIAQAFDQDAIKKSILSVLDQQAEGWNEGSIEKYMEGYWHSDSVRFVSGGNVTYGWTTTLARYKKGYPDSASMGKLFFSDIDVTRLGELSKDAAVVFGKWRLMREKDEPWGYFTLLFRKTKNGWKIVHDHTSAAEKR